MCGSLSKVGIDAVAPIALMALDHPRDFFGVAGVSPTDVTRASAPLFFADHAHVRAVFFLLTGADASLARGRRTHAQLARLLCTRSLWLIVLELTVVR
jgi:uncharacterized membrane protein